jgi:hypothetical protein
VEPGIGIFQEISDGYIIMLDNPIPEKFVWHFKGKRLFVLIQARTNRLDPGFKGSFSNARTEIFTDGRP